MSKTKRSILLLLTHVTALAPLAWLLVDGLTGNLTANPIQAATLRTGKPALVLLVLSLSVTPMNTLFGLRALIPLRRWLGLYAAMYAGLHFLIFIGLDYGFDLKLLQGAIFEKRYALAGFVSGLLLLPLAITSTRGWMRRLGKRWKQLHLLVYAAAFFAVVHYLWLVKSDIRVPLLYAAIVAGLLALRVPAIRRRASRLGTRKPISTLRSQLGFGGQGSSPTGG